MLLKFSQGPLENVELKESVNSFQSEVFVVAFSVLAAGAIILTLNVLLGGHIIVFQSLSLLSYCLFPLDVEAHLFAYRQCHCQVGCGGDNISMELLSSISIHECSCQSKEKGPSPLSSRPYVYLCCFFIIVID